MLHDSYMSKNWTEMIRPTALEVDNDELTKAYGKFVAKPLERGYGLTLGNSLRRVLLSSIQGAGIVAIKIDGAEHEFSTLANIKEEVSEIILNLKEVKFKISDKEQVTLSLEKSSEGAVTAADISEHGNVTVLNPDHVICNLSAGANLRMEIILGLGKGYVTADDNKEKYELPVGYIYLDTLFSPVQRVNYTVTNSRVGKRTDFDKLTLEVWTNAGIDPVDAVSLSSKILRDQLTVFLNFEDEDTPVEINKPVQVASNPTNEALLKPVSELELSVRSANCLQNANIKYIYELVSRTEGEMLRTKNFGRKSLNEIKEILNNMGLGLGMKVDAAIMNTHGPIQPLPNRAAPAPQPMGNPMGGNPMGGNNNPMGGMGHQQPMRNPMNNPMGNPNQGNPMNNPMGNPNQGNPMNNPMGNPNTGANPSNNPFSNNPNNNPFGNNGNDGNNGNNQGM